MIQHGTRPTKPDHRDYSHLRTYGAPLAPSFPPDFNVDAKLWCPDQNAMGLPFGCTDVASADISADLDHVLKDPQTLEAVTHANARGGIDIREALKGARSIGWLKQFFNVQPYAPLDAFDSIRYAILSGDPEHRAVSWGSPWYPEWENAALGNTTTKNPDGSFTVSAGGKKDGIVPMPFTLKPAPSMPWHNSVFCGWKTINGVVYLINRSWQGTGVGDNGLLYFPREVINAVMQIPGTVAFTATNNPVADVQTISLPAIQLLLSYVRQALLNILSLLK